VIQQKLIEAKTLLSTLETQRSLVGGIDPVRNWWKTYDQFEHLLLEIEQATIQQGTFPQIKRVLHQLKKRQAQLFPMPHMGPILEAQNLLQFPNLGVLVLNTSIEEVMKGSGTVQITLVERDGKVIFDHKFALPTPGMVIKNGKTDKQDTSAPPLSVWETLCEGIKGHFLLTPDSMRLQVQLIILAKHFELEPPAIIGLSFVDFCLSYFGLEQMNSWEALEMAPMLPLMDFYKQVGMIPQPTYSATEQTSNILQAMQDIAQGHFLTERSS